MLLPVASCRLSCQLLENHARQKASCHVLIIYKSPSTCHTPKSPTMSANNRIKIPNSKTMEVDVDVETPLPLVDDIKKRNKKKVGSAFLIVRRCCMLLITTSLLLWWFLIIVPTMEASNTVSFHSASSVVANINEAVSLFPSASSTATTATTSTAAATPTSHKPVTGDIICSEDTCTKSSNDNTTDTETTSDINTGFDATATTPLLKSPTKSDMAIEELTDDYIRSLIMLSDAVAAIDTTSFDERLLFLCEHVVSSCQHLPTTSVGPVDRMADVVVRFFPPFRVVEIYFLFSFFNSLLRDPDTS